MFAPVGTLLERTGSLLDEWGSVDWPACDPAAVRQAAAQLLRDVDRLQAIALLAVGEHERQGGIRLEGDASAADWAARQTRSSRDAGQRTAIRARRLAAAAKTAQAAAEGRLSVEQADRLAAARTDANAPVFDAREEELIARAVGSLEDAIRTAGEFRAETGETPQDRDERLWRRRSAACWDDDDGMIQGRQSLAGDGGAVWKTTFDTFVDREFKKGDPADGRTNAQKRADAAIAMAMAARAGLDDDAPSWAARATVTVGIRYEDLVADQVVDSAGEDLGTGQPLCGEAVRRLCCDADLVRLVTKGDSLPIDVGRKTRSIPTATRTAVLARDGGCTFPGCHHRDGLQVHHLRHWARLGATDLANLACLCWRHHRLVHEGGWTVELDAASQRTIWSDPGGRRRIGQRRPGRRGGERNPCTPVVLPMISRSTAASAGSTRSAQSSGMTSRAKRSTWAAPAPGQPHTR